VAGATVMVVPAAEDSDQDLDITIVKPEKAPTPVGVGARKEGEEAADEPADDGGALDQPAVQPPDPE